VANIRTATVTITSASHRVTIGGYGTGTGQLLAPAGLAVSPSGTVYVTDAGIDRVLAFDAKGKLVAAWGGPGSGAGQFDGIGAVAVGPRGTVYVADTLNQRIELFSPTGRFLNQVPASWPSALRVLGPGLVESEDAMTGAWTSADLPTAGTPLRAPSPASAVAVRTDGTYAVATGPEIRVYAPNGSQEGSWTIPPAYGNRDPAEITGLAWEGATLYALDGRYNRVLAIDTAVPATTIRVTAHGLVDDGTVDVLALPSHLLLGPSALTVDQAGHLWIANTDRRQVVEISATGQLLQRLAVNDGPRGIAVLTNGEVAVSGYWGDTVTLYDPAGRAVARVGQPGRGPDDLDHPTTLVALPTGGFAVWDEGNSRTVLYTAAGVPEGFIQDPAGTTALAVLGSGTLAFATPAGLVPVRP
jgi:hypothetical protein